MGRAAVGGMEQPEWARLWGAATRTRGFQGRILGCHKSTVPLSNGTHRQEWGFPCSLFPNLWLLPPWTLWEAPTQAGLHSLALAPAPPIWASSCAPTTPRWFWEQMPVGVHAQRWDWNHSWDPGAVQLRKQSRDPSPWLHKLQIYKSTAGSVKSASTEHVNKQLVLPWLGHKCTWQLWVLWVFIAGAGSGPGVGCLNSTHSRHRCLAATVLGSHSSGSVLVALWKTKCERHRGWLPVSHGNVGVESSANYSVRCKPTKWVKSDTTEYTHRWPGPVEEYSAASLPVGACQSRLPHSA